MSPSKLGLFASLALAANAVLIPPSMTAAELGDDNALETFAINPFKRTVAVECPVCAVATLHGKTLNWEKDPGNAFVSFPSPQSPTSRRVPDVRCTPYLDLTINNDCYSAIRTQLANSP